MKNISTLTPHRGHSRNNNMQFMTGSERVRTHRVLLHLRNDITKLTQEKSKFKIVTLLDDLIGTTEDYNNEIEYLSNLISQLSDVDHSSYQESSGMIKKVDSLTEMNKSQEKECISASQNESHLERSLLNMSYEHEKLLKSINDKNHPAVSPIFRSQGRESTQLPVQSKYFSKSQTHKSKDSAAQGTTDKSNTK